MKRPYINIRDRNNIIMFIDRELKEMRMNNRYSPSDNRYRTYLRSLKKKMMT